MYRRFKKLNALLILALVASAFSFDTQHAGAASIVPWKSVVHVGDTVSFSGRNWIVLDPDAGYLLASDLDSGGPRSFDSSNKQLFDPGNSENLAYWLNRDFYNSLSDRLWIQNYGWKAGNEQDESGRIVNANVGLLSYFELRYYRPYLSVPPDRYWLITPHKNNQFYVWFANNSLSSAIGANRSYGVRPAVHLKSALSVSSGSGTSVDPFVIINQIPEIELSDSNGRHILSSGNGNETFTLTGKAADKDGGDVTVRATLGGVTKTATVTGAPTALPGADNFTLTWNAAADHPANGTFNNLSVTVDDGNGGTSSASYGGTLTVDTIGPNEPAFQFSSPAGYSSGAATKEDVVFTVQDGADAGTGPFKSQYRTRLNGGGWSDWADYSAAIPVSQEGRTDVEAVTYDKAGNVSTAAPAQVLIDRTSPSAPGINFTSPADYSSGKVSYQNVTFTISDGTDTGSGILKSQYRTSGDHGATWSLWTDYLTPVSITQAGATEVEARTVDKAGNESDSAAAQAQIVKAAPSASNVEVTGTPVEGQTLTGSYSYGDMNGDAESGTTYQWYRSDDAALTVKHMPIAGAVSQAYVLQAGDIGKYISFEVTPRSAEEPMVGTPVESAATAKIGAAPAAPAASDVLVAGSPVQGQTLTGSYAYADVNGDTESGSTFQWYRSDDPALTLNHTAIAGATGRNYVLQAEDIGKYISFQVTPRTETAPTTGTAAESAATAKIEQAPAAPVAAGVMVTGSAVQGQTLTGTYTYADANGDSETGSTYQWYRSDDSGLTKNHTAIAGADQTAYILQADDIGKYISFEVTPRSSVEPKVGQAVESPATSVILAGPSAPMASGITVTGTPAEGQTLTGSYIYSDVNGDAESGSTYQWYRSDDSALKVNHKAVDGAVSRTYVLQAGDVGKYISFQVIPRTETAPTTGTTVESAATGKIGAAPAAPGVSGVSVAGSTVQGQTLTGSYIYFDVNGDAESGSAYQWYRSDDSALKVNHTAIPGAAGRIYVLQAEDVGKYISFQVTPHTETAPATGEAVESAATAKIEAAPVVQPPGQDQSGSSGSSDSVLTPPAVPGKEYIPIDVQITGISGTLVSTLVVERTLNADGTKKDVMNLTADQVRPAVNGTSAAGTSSVTVFIPDTKDEVAETNVTLPKDVVKLLDDAHIGLNILTANAGLQIPAQSLQGFTGDLVLDLKTVKTEDAKLAILGRISKDPGVTKSAGGKEIKVVGRPMMIDTNLHGRDVTLTLPLRESGLSQAQLDHLAVFIEHSDGQKELVKGTQVPLVNNGGMGYQFAVKKFSTFTMIYADGLTVANPQPAYITGYTDGTFKPEAHITRSEIAEILSRVITRDSQGEEAVYRDVKPGSWAYTAISKVTTMGLMHGYTDGTFGPERPLTRAEMAKIVSALLTGGTGSGHGFSDTAGNWAEAEIRKVQGAGIINGYKDGTFRPNSPLTRAEAVVIMNKVLHWSPVNGPAASHWKDVPDSYWALHDIAAAAGSSL
ncbi:S-layer homology domain-containing protein [Paenibacillus sp. J22TS3]|uniref:S-layer homology domain-containing protein n=1 Tax=Paenibacillus sp. J22TS3 TaxID=2807192 RepID=UPI001B1B7CDF|nr:S-layer homology domain-containing protein [Paenibacillus sp. J22TS3]GIP22841.1 hypothetical protein J22TS3_31160 [Paenibacillus sp. J22TS3]